MFKIKYLSSFPLCAACAICATEAHLKTPTPIVERLNNEVNRALPAINERYRELGNEIAGGARDVFARFISTEVTRWAKVVKASGATAE